MNNTCAIHVENYDNDTETSVNPPLFSVLSRAHSKKHRKSHTQFFF